MGLRSVVGWAFTLVGSYFGQTWAVAVGQGMIARDNYLEQKKARRRALAEYNASLEDRLEMFDLQPQAPRTLVLGRVRHVEGVRRRWTSGTNDEKLTMVVSFAGHEIDAFESWYLDDIPVTLDGSGWVQTAPYLRTERVQYSESAVLDVTGAAVVVLPAAPVDAGAVHAVWFAGSGETMTQGTATVDSVVGSTVTLSGGEPLATVYVNYSGDVATSHVRIRPYLGTSAQNVGSDLAAEYPAELTATDKFAGIALAVVDCIYNPDIFPQGRPNVTAVMRGAKCFDPRDDSTVWTENPALHALHYATWAHGWNLASGDYNLADIEAAADLCDVSTDFTMRLPDDSTSEVTLPRYRCGITISAGADHAEAMDAIMETMAGRHGWAGGVWRMRAGGLAATATTITQDWLVNNTDAGRPDTEPVITAVQAVPRVQRINRVTGACVDPTQRYQLLPFPAVEDSVLVGLYGQRSLEVELQGVNHIAHAQHIASMAIRQAQAGLRLELTCGQQAATLELFDVVELDMARYGFENKTFEVVGWTWFQAAAYKVVLAEITAAMFTVEAELTGRDPAPDSNLRPPWDVEAITGLAVTSGTTALQDGSILTRTAVEWDAAVGENIRQGGSIEIQYTQAAEALPAGDWASWVEQGSSTSTVIPGLMAGRHYLFRVRAVQGQPLVRGPWSAAVLHQVADAPAVAGTAVLQLQSDGFAFVFDGAADTTSDSPTITFEAVLHNVSGTATFTATAYNAAGTSLGTITLGGSGNTRTLTAAQFNNSGAWATQYVRVLAELGALSDTTTVYRGDNGSSAVQAMLTNEAHTLPRTTAGVVTYTGSGTTIRVFEGTTELDYDGVGTAAGKWTASRSVTSGTVSTPGAISESGLTAVMADHAGMSTSAAQITVTITGKTAAGASFSLTKIQSLAWSSQGDTGADGSDAQTLTLSATGFAFIFDSPTDTTADAPASIVFTANRQNVPSGTVTFSGTAYNAAGTVLGSVGGVTLTGSGDTRTLSAANFNAAGATTVRYVIVTATLGSLSDTMTIYRGDGGTDGVSAVQAMLTNEAHTMPAAADGTVSSYAGSGTTIRVFEGVTELDYNGVGTTPGTWTASRSVTTGTMTAGAISESGLTAVVANHSAMTTDLAIVTYTISGQTAAGDAFSFTKLQTLSKAKAGAAGADGDDGTAGASARIAYALFTGNPTGVAWDAGATLTVSGDSLPGASTVSNPNAATAWTSTTQAPASGQAMFQSDGVYNPATNQTVWQSPYLSNFRVGSLSAISADLGTITAGSLNTSGWVKADGNTSYTVTLSSGSSSVTTSIMGNTTGGAQYGVIGQSSTAAAAGVYGYNSSAASNTAGVMGYSLNFGVVGYGPVAGVAGISTAGGGNGVQGFSSSSAGAGAGVYASNAFNTSNNALQVVGKSTFSGQITSTYNSGAPFVVASTTVVANLNAALLNGTTWAAPGAIGGTTPAAGSFTTLNSSGLASLADLRINKATTIGGAAANNSVGGAALVSKPGSDSNNVWLAININGTTYYLPVWT